MAKLCHKIQVGCKCKASSTSYKCIHDIISSQSCHFTSLTSYVSGIQASAAIRDELGIIITRAKYLECMVLVPHSLECRRGADWTYQQRLSVFRISRAVFFKSCTHYLHSGHRNYNVNTSVYAYYMSQESRAILQAKYDQ